MLELYLSDVLAHPIKRNYKPSHCWYYYTGNIPLAIGDIEISDLGDYYLPKTEAKLKDEYISTTKHLANDIQRYEELWRDGLKGFVGYIPYTNMEGWRMDWCTALSLKHNHISYNKGKLLAIMIESGKYDKVKK